MNIGTYYCVLIKNYIALLEFVIRQSIDRRNTMSPKTAKNDLEICFYFLKIHFDASLTVAVKELSWFQVGHSYHFLSTRKSKLTFVCGM